MDAGGSRLQIILAILRKDTTLLFRDFLFVFLTILVLVVFVALYWVLPSRVDETITVGVHGAGIEQALERMSRSNKGALDVKRFASSKDLLTAVGDRKVEAGIDFPNNFLADTFAGKESTVTVLLRPTLPPEVREAMTTMVRELAYAIGGHPLPVKMPAETTVVLGADRSGQQVPLRDKLRPLYAFIVLIMEAIGMGGLIASEVQNRTLSAILATPARIFDVLSAKIIVGTGVAFSEAIIILLLVRGFGPSPLIVLVALLLGAVMVTGVAMIAGSAGRDLVGTMFNGMLMLIPMAIPAFAVLFPGAAAPWVRVLPSYGLVDVMINTSSNGAGWSESAIPLLTLSGWCIAIVMIGTLVLRRRARLS